MIMGVCIFLQNIIIVGAGKGGYALLKLIEQADYLQVIAIVDMMKMLLEWFLPEKKNSYVYRLETFTESRYSDHH